MERRYIESFFFLALLLGTLAVVIVMVLPFASILILAAVLAFLFSAPYERMVRAFGGRRSLAALVMTVIVLVTILVPLSFAAWRIGAEAGALYSYLRDHTDPGEVLRFVSRAELMIRGVVPGFQLDPADVTAQTQRALQWVVSHLGALFAQVTRLVISFLFLLLFFYYILRDGNRLKRRLMELSPLADDQEELIVSKLGRAVTSVVRGAIILHVIQGVVAGIGFAIFGLPNPALWGAATMLAGFVPSLGTALVFVPAVAYLLLTGHGVSAVALSVWGAAVVGLLDNFLGPKLVASGLNIHPLIIMLSVLGGVSLFGPIGILMGPIIVSLLFALFDIYLALVRGPYLKEHAADR
jgi:predicted PurR-regulated permease PerM